MSEIINGTSMSKNIRLTGIVTIILGILAITAPLAVGVSISLLVGLLVLLGIKLLIVGSTLLTVGTDLQSISVNNDKS